MQPPQPPGAVVAMTPAQIERQDMQCAWLRLAIAAQERRAVMKLDRASLELPKEPAPCAA
jgi:hypothetical protein